MDDEFETMSLRDDTVNIDDVEYVEAKSYMQQARGVYTGGEWKQLLPRFDHLSKIITRFLDERPKNAADILEDFSKEAKQTRFAPQQDTIFDKPDKSAQVELAEIQKQLFDKGEGFEGMEGAAEPEPETETPLPNLMELSYFFEQAGIGLNREEMFHIWLSLKSLIETHPIDQIRFWGKILGTRQNYIVAEVQYREGEDDDDEREAEETLDDIVEKDNDDEDEVEAEVVDVIPKPNFKPPPVVPKEENRTGANKKTYFVCNEPGKPWIKLPQVTPAQITMARKIKKFFTGDLEAEISSYPPFPGNESNYLQAQIARISAGTHISPLGIYQFDEEEEEEEDGAARHNFLLNTEYEPVPARELADPSLSNWVHHVLHILPQGRTTWWNPVQKRENELDENDEEEEEKEQETVEPEVGPPILSPLSEDAEVNNMAPWMTRTSSKLMPHYAIAVIHSSLWPGAHAFASGKHFENIYIGWGHKYSSENFNPMLTAVVQEEFPLGPEITEIEDPTPQQEAELKAETEEQQKVEEEDAEEDNEMVEDARGDDEDEDDQ